jgi:hypothetical protein
MAEADETPFEEAAREFMRWIYARLEEDYEHQTSDETIAETLINNECYFTQEGKMHHE